MEFSSFCWGPLGVSRQGFPYLMLRLMVRLLVAVQRVPDALSSSSFRLPLLFELDL